MNEKYKMKYLKYKNKYLILKNQVAGMHYLPMHEHESCAICGEDFELDDYEIRQCTNALNHMFHRACIEPWLATHNTCPICILPFEPPQQPVPLQPHQLLNLNRVHLLVRYPNLYNLQFLDLGGNQIQTIDTLTFQYLPNLRLIWLINNQIQNINPQTFQNLPNLQQLNLTGNPLQNIVELRTSLPGVTIHF
jgi:Leucine-rich repeat (LRR) protein